MRWKGRRQSENIEDRRGVSAGGAIAGGGIGVVVIALIAMLFGVDPTQFLGAMPAEQPGIEGQAPTDPESLAQKEFVSVVLADTEDVWNQLFRERGRTYKEPTLVLFSGRVQSACGLASAAVGPFYCPPDQQVYIDTSFFGEMERRFKAAGDFARAYVIAHEVGHHVQNLLGVAGQVETARRQLSEQEFNKLSVRMELQADFYAGVFAHHAQRTKNILDPNDIEEALRAANAIGDDALQMQSQGYVVPDGFTHGTSEQRVRWFRKGLESGRMEDGDTFRASRL
jgi:predicted metalloprotease